MNVRTDQIDPRNTDIKIRETNLEKVKVYKYLGVHIDNSLNVQYHNKILTRNVNFKVTQFQRIRKFITKSAAELMHNFASLGICRLYS